MHNKHLSLLLALCLALAACGDKSKQKVDDAGEELQTAGHDLKDAVIEAVKDDSDDWQKFKADAELQINKNQTHIDSLKHNWPTLGKLKTEYQRHVSELEMKNAHLKQQLESYKDQSQQAWQQFQTDFDKHMNQLKAEINDSTYHDF